MFIQVKRSGYTADGEQYCSGLFLILTQPQQESAKYPSTKDECFDCKRNREAHSEMLKDEGCRYFRSTSMQYPIRAIVRHVSMSQLGHFMMGQARVHGHRLTLSGAYGSDGLPDTVPDQVYESGLELPKALREAWNHGGGWNGTGNEAPAMRRWALEHLAELRK